MTQLTTMRATEPRFSAAQLAPSDATLSPKEFWDKVIRRNKATYIGPGLPDIFVSQPPDNTATPRTFMAQSLDKLAQFLRKLNCPDLPNLTFNMGKQRFSLKQAGKGVYGSTYQLSTEAGTGKPSSFAFKVFWKPVMYDVFNDNRDGPVGEMMNGILFNNRASDVPQFYLGNPHRNKQWMLSEWVDTNTPLKPGVPISTLVKDLKLNLHDDHSGNRFSNGYRVDRGSISTLSTLGFWYHVVKTRLTIITQSVFNFFGNAFDWLFRPGYQKTLKSCRSLATQLGSATQSERPDLKTKMEQALNKVAQRFQPHIANIQVQP